MSFFFLVRARSSSLCLLTIFCKEAKYAKIRASIDDVTDGDDATLVGMSGVALGCSLHLRKGGSVLM